MDATPTRKTNVTLEDRTGCCWPIGDKNFLFCNEIVDASSKNGWCTDHYKKGTVPLASRPKRNMVRS